jgi:hypothetical protein
MKKFKVKSANELIRLSIINGCYTPRSNEEIALEKEDIIAAKKMIPKGGLLASLVL